MSFLELRLYSVHVRYSLQYVRFRNSETSRYSACSIFQVVDNLSKGFLTKFMTQHTHYMSRKTVLFVYSTIHNAQMT